MASVKFHMFGGIRTSLGENLRRAAYGKVSRNTMLRDGYLTAFKEPRQVTPFVDFNSDKPRKSLWLLYDTGECCTGLATFSRYTSVLEPPAPGGCAAFSAVALFPCGAGCPEPQWYFPCDDATHPIVVPKPELPLVAKLITPSLDLVDADYAGPDQRSYTYTWVDQFGTESPPAPPTEAHLSYDDEVWELTGFDTPPANAVCVRIYRTSSYFENFERQDMPSGSTFQLVEEVPLDGGTPSFYTDSRSLIEMDMGTLQTEENCPPPCMTDVQMVESGHAVGFSGNSLFVSERYEMHNWPERLRVELPDRIVGIAIHYDTVYIGTTGRPYYMEVEPVTVDDEADTRVEALPFTENLPCLTRFAMVASDSGALYPSHKGLVALKKGRPAALVSRGIIDEDDWVEWVPNVAAWHNGKYYASRSPTGRGFIMDLQDGTEGEPDIGDFVEIEWAPAMIHAGHDGRLYFLEDGTTYAWHEGYKRRRYTWRSKQVRTPGHTTMAALKIVGDWGEPVDVRVIADGREYDRLTVSDSLPVRLKANGRGVEWGIEVSGTTTISEIHLATSYMELTLGGSPDSGR